MSSAKLQTNPINHWLNLYIPHNFYPELSISSITQRRTQKQARVWPRATFSPERHSICMRSIYYKHIFLYIWLVRFRGHFYLLCRMVAAIEESELIFLVVPIALSSPTALRRRHESGGKGRKEGNSYYPSRRHKASWQQTILLLLLPVSFSQSQFPTYTPNSASEQE